MVLYILVCFAVNSTFLVDLIRLKLKIDDSLDVFAVHGVGGMLGTILCSVLMTQEFGGVGLDEGVTVTTQFLYQAKSVLYAVVWTTVFTYIALKITSIVTDLRVDDENESSGLDNSLHGESGYTNL